MKIEKKKNIKDKIKKVFDTRGSILCEIIASEEQNYLEMSYARTKNGKYVKRPIEDQAPFMNRKLFLKEMIIEPIDQ